MFGRHKTTRWRNHQHTRSSCRRRCKSLGVSQFSPKVERTHKTENLSQWRTCASQPDDQVQFAGCAQQQPSACSARICRRKQKHFTARLAAGSLRQGANRIHSRTRNLPMKYKVLFPAHVSAPVQMVSTILADRSLHCWPIALSLPLPISSDCLMHFPAQLSNR